MAPLRGEGWGVSMLRVLGLFPHPDDEAYAAGAVLAHCAEAGADVRVVCATRGEAGSDRRGAAQPGAALAACRTAELAASCRALGIAPPALLDLPDGGLATLDAEACARDLAGRLSTLQPRLVITLGRDGAYGNRDHMAWTAIVDAAAATLAPAPRLLHAAFPRGLFAPVWRALRGRPEIVAALDPTRLGVDAAAVDLRLAVGPQRARKLAAIAAHASQLVGGDPFTFLRPGLLETLLAEEWFVVASGPALAAGCTDPLAGL